MKNPKETFLTSVAGSIQDNTFVKLSLAGYRGDEPSLHKIVVKVVALASGEHLSFVYRHATKDVTKNRPIADGLAQIGTWLGSDFRRARVFTTVKDTELIFEEGKPPRLVQAKATHTRRTFQRTQSCQASAHQEHGNAVSDAIRRHDH